MMLRLQFNDCVALSFCIRLSCKLISSGETEHIYDHDTEFFHIVNSQEWAKEAAESRFKGFLHPYVQIPIWAYAWQPACNGLNFNQFNALITAISAMSISAIILICISVFGNTLLNPLKLIILLIAIWFSEPFKYAFFLTQNHLSILLLVISAWLADTKNKSISAGALLSIAAAVKITPAAFILYFIAKQRYRSAAYAAAFSFAILIANYILLGSAVSHSFFDELHRVSSVWLPSFNNQSLAGMIGGIYMPSEIAGWRINALPVWIKISSIIFVLIATYCSGLIDRSRNGHGLCLAILAITVASPISWTHYYLAIIIPSILIADHATKNIALLILLAATIALNIYPIAVDPITASISNIGIIRSHLYSGLILMLTIIVITIRSNSSGEQLARTEVKHCSLR